MDRQAHWDAVYAAKQPTEASWYQPRPTRSLELLRESGAGAGTSVIDVGGGDSTLVDALLEQGFHRVTVLDVSRAALARARARLGAAAERVTWIEADVTRVELPPARYDVWHDRAAFHFLTDAEDRARYVERAACALRPGGSLVLATFAPEGPARCSGLQVVRYAPGALARELGPAFALQHDVSEVHRTPAGVGQRFTYAVFRRR